MGESEWSSISVEAKDLITKLLVKDAKKRISAAEVIRHPWLETNNNNELETPARLKMFEARSVSMFAESAASVQRVVLQLDLAMEDGGGHHGDGDDGGQVVSLSPPSQSTLMLRRRALYNSQSAARLRTCAPLVEESMMNHAVESPC